MSQKLKDFLFSYGLILAGVFLLFISSVTFSSLPVESDTSFYSQFPLYVVSRNVGGDENKIPPVPVSRAGVGYVATTTALANLVMDYETKAVLINKNAGEKRPLASVTKLMSALVLLDVPMNWQVSETIVESDDQGGDHHVKVGEEYALEDLWNIALIGSSNMAISALVRASGLGTEEFVARMNQKAKELKLSSAEFTDPTGLSEGNVASALDAAKLLREALRFEKIYDVLRLGEYEARPLGAGKPNRVWTTNWLLTNWIPNDFGVNAMGKTGYISTARYNFVGNFTDRRGYSLIVVVFGADTNESRFTEALDLANWTFTNYEWSD